ncbi:MAG TPA: serine/threonine-protein kinase, partial [Minicystis sp.]|nr:serine/threonine-protein kinase [Minicystis sp.]
MTTEEALPGAADAAAKARAAALVGQVISGRYRIVELVAMGGMGAVYRGEHLRMRKRIAIKVLHPDIEGLPDLVARFEREAVAGAHLSHPNAAAATDFGELEDGSTFLVLEYVAGRTLRAVIDEEGPLPPERAARIARQLATVLGAAHAAGIVHRDVKPRNVMLVEGTEDFVKLIDFGLAKVAADRLSTEASDDRARRAMGPLTGQGMLLGTVAYLAPEAALGMDGVDASSDLYALGLILYELLAGKRPFDAKTPGAMFRAHRFEPPPPIAARSPAARVPVELEAVAMRLLEKDKRRRYATGEEVAQALDAAMAADASPKPVSVRPSAHPAPPAKGARSRTPFVAAACVVAFVGAAAATLRVSSGPRASVTP